MTSLPFCLVRHLRTQFAWTCVLLTPAVIYEAALFRIKSCGCLLHLIKNLQVLTGFNRKSSGCQPYPTSPILQYRIHPQGGARRPVQFWIRAHDEFFRASIIVHTYCDRFWVYVLIISIWRFFHFESMSVWKISSVAGSELRASRWPCPLSLIQRVADRLYGVYKVHGNYGRVFR